MIYYWAALSPPAFTWMLEFFCMIMMYNEIQPWIDDYQVFVWVLVGLHHNFVILRTWILKVFNKNTISALVRLPSTRLFSYIPSRLIKLLPSYGNIFVLCPTTLLLERHPVHGKVLYPSQDQTTCQNSFLFIYPGCFLTPWFLNWLSLLLVWYHISLSGQSGSSNLQHYPSFLFFGHVHFWHFQPGFREDFISRVSAGNHQIWS